jgi:hypothetical protein|uniref:Uncharacterized protein n=1 Tax=Globisporangium ultimum (strain ATCC 200006 / CBS 805.95 / DAOM BR144) TaxID=431595 RepID=K3WDY1_GLOUD
MKLASIILAAAATFAAVNAQATTPAPAGTVAAPNLDTPATTAPTAATANATTTTTTTTAPAASGDDALAAFKATATSDDYHMAPIRVVQARVQSDSPILVEGALVSSFGKGKLDAGYLSSLDTVNTASVEGALMYVQAEAINVATRAAENRCVRKTKVANVVFYEILIAQTNETIAQFQDKWETPEYGPMLAMDSGRCTPISGEDTLPVECYQFNGENGQPNVGPFVGGTNKEKSDRAPYPGNYWFSFPNTCPTQGWSNKTDECRTSTRKGLCPYGVAPNGVECTFAYNILGWVPIDDVVGITSFTNNATGKPYANFTEWCSASTDNVEFEYDESSKTLKQSLPFWEDPLNETANAARTEAMIAAYTKLLTEGSSQVSSTVSAAFKALPTPTELAAINPPCFKTVKSCGSGNGCKRTGYSQLCTPCEAGEGCKTSEDGFTFPTLAKAPTTLSEAETTTVGLNGGSGSGTSKSTVGTPSPSTSAAGAQVTMALASVAVSLIASFAL